MTTQHNLTSSIDWKDHPVVIAAGSVAAALLFAWNFVVPLKTAALESEVEVGKKQIEVLKTDAAKSEADYKNKMDELLKQKINIETRLKETASRLSEYETKDTFVSGNPYPIGISVLKLGSDFDTIEISFPDAIKNKVNSRITSVSIDHAVFSGITFYKERFNRGRPGIIQIVYQLKNKEYRAALDLTLNAAFGSPREVLNGNKAWNIGRTSVVLLKESVSISPLGTRPGSWDID